LELNTDKTKILIFRSNKKLKQPEFNFNGHELRSVDQIKYLGITWDYTGNFGNAIKELKVRGMRAYFKIMSSLKSHNISSGKVAIKLFDSMVKPILLYGCQIWGQNFTKCLQKDDFGQFDKLSFEDVQNKMCKFVLHVGKQTSNLTSRAELGRYPLFISAAVLTIKFLVKLIQSPDKLAYSAYIEERDSNKGNNWMTFCEAILKRCNVTADSLSNNSSHVFTSIRKCLEKQYQDFFYHRIHSIHGNNGQSGNKLRTYKLLKHDYVCEPYITANLPPKYASLISKIRISAHELEIENGRRARPLPVPCNQRYCKHCKDQVEDEIHFVMKCSLYNELRMKLFSDLDKLISVNNVLHDDVKTFTLLFTSDIYVFNLYLGKFLENCLKKRANYLQNTM
jgi:hypothetical protein